MSTTKLYFQLYFGSSGSHVAAIPTIQPLTQLLCLLDGPIRQRDAGEGVQRPLGGIAAAHALKLIECPHQQLSAALEGVEDSVFLLHRQVSFWTTGQLLANSQSGHNLESTTPSTTLPQEVNELRDTCSTAAPTLLYSS